MIFWDCLDVFAFGAAVGAASTCFLFVWLLGS